ncbi:hypothetical protein [Geomonas propionica]|uniref:Uncharacterized protein n=1 Tax=Geomonas propionica TaxID=2798582 RepID=A0ABS0YXK7_9BACT|nr:hypothetical protein [Geomonas propionica]MBJ6802674.1 hypothetical protein [Geomonas propionica]
MKPIHHCKLRIFADYRQFYLWDPVASERLAPTEWTDDDVHRRIKIADHVVVICPERNMEVPVHIRLFDKDPGFTLGQWDHIAEAPLLIQSGILEVHECTGSDLAAFSVAPGQYRIRSMHCSLGQLSEDGLEGEDHYQVDIWPSQTKTMIIIKQWEEGNW